MVSGLKTSSLNLKQRDVARHGGLEGWTGCASPGLHAAWRNGAAKGGGRVVNGKAVRKRRRQVSDMYAARPARGGGGRTEAWYGRSGERRSDEVEMGEQKRCDCDRWEG